MARRHVTTAAERGRSWDDSATRLAAIRSSAQDCGTAIVMNAWHVIAAFRGLDLVAAPATVAEKPSPRVTAVQQLQMVVALVVALVVVRAVATFSEVIISRAAAYVATVASAEVCGCSSFLKLQDVDPVRTVCPAIAVAEWMKRRLLLLAATAGAIPEDAILVGAASLD